MITYLITESQISVIKEKLKPSQFRDYVKAWKDVGGESFYDDIFRGKNRLYIPLEDYNAESDVTEDLKNEINELLSKTNWELVSVKDNKAKNPSNNRESKLTKVLTKDKNIPDSSAAPILKKLNKMYSLKSKGSTSDYMVVISRHPYDVVGMSTDRGWTSCTNLETGKLRYQLINDVKLGTIIAYLIKKNDKNIERPQARILIKPFVNQETSEIFLFSEPRVYGTPVEGFKQTVMGWLDGHQKATKGKYELVKGLHNDGACSIDFTDEQKELLYYLRYQDIKRIETLLFNTDYGKNINKSDGCDILYTAILNDSSVSLLKTILKHPNIDPSCDPNKTIVLATRMGNYKLIPLFIKYMELDYQTSFDILDETLKQYDKKPSEGLKKIIQFIFNYIDPSMNNNRLLARFYKMNKNNAVQLLLTDDRVKEKLQALKT